MTQSGAPPETGGRKAIGIALANGRAHPREILVTGARDAGAERRQRRMGRRDRAPDVGNRGAGRHVAVERLTAGQFAQSREQLDAYAHAVSRARRRASSSSTSAVAPSTHASPSSKYSCFQIGAICFTRSIA